MIKVWAFFPVYLDAYKIAIHEMGCRRIFKTFFFHHMTPMTSRISNAYKNGFVLLSCFCQSLFRPGKPINRIMGVLQ
jgi:hypothetical protein